MSPWARWRIAVPLMGLTGLCLAAAVTGTIVWWSADSITDRALLITASLVFLAGFAASLSVGVTAADEVPWWRVGIAVLSIAAGCGLSVFL